MHRIVLFLSLLLAASGVVDRVGLAGDVAPPDGVQTRAGVPGIDEINSRIAALRDTNASDAATSIRELQQAIALLEQADADLGRVRSIQKGFESAPDTAEDLRKQLRTLVDQVGGIEAEIAAAADWSIDALQEKSDALRAQVADARRSLNQMRIAQLRRIEESSRLAESIDSARGDFIEASERAREALEKDPAIDNAATVLAAAAEARASARRAYLRILPQRLIVNAEIEELRLRIAEERSFVADAKWRAWTAVLERRLAGESDSIARAESELAGVSDSIPVLDRAAAKSRALVEQSRALRTRDAGRMERADDLFARADTLDRLLAIEIQQLMLGGSEAIGEGLRRQIVGIGQIEALQRELADLRREALQLYLLELELGQQLATLQSPEQEAQRLVRESGAGAGDPNEVEATLTALLESRRTLIIRPMLSEVRDQLSSIDELAQAVNSLLDSLARLQSFLLENLFTLRTGAPLGPPALVGLASAGEAVPDRIGSSLFSAMQASINARPTWWIAALLGFASMLALRRRVSRRLLATGKRIQQIATDSFWQSIEAFGLTVFLAAPLPLAMLLLGQALESGGGTDAFLLILGETVAAMAIPASVLSLVREIARPGGLGEAHFRWRTALTERLRRAAFVLLALAVPCYAIALLMLVGVGLRTTEGSESISRIAFIACSLLSSSMVAWSFSRGRTSPKRRGLAMKAAIFIAVAAPLTVAALAWLGYALAAFQVIRLVFQSAWIVVGNVVLRDLLVRWLSAASRKIAREQLERKRLEMMAEPPSQIGGGSDIAEATEELEVDLAKVNAQALRVIQSVFLTATLLGLAVVWSGMLPALSGLNQVVLWETITAVTSTVDEGTVTVLQPISILDLLGAMLVVLLTVVLTRDIPGLLQLLVLPRLPVSAGVGYAITSFTRYALAVIGILIAFNMIGLRWNQVQWLASAAVLGLSFGLQEIFSNFVSGVLMLVEQPVRVGDVVTVNGVTGRVTRIQIRATTITDWDRRDLVIPNKAFITGQFSNWTLSDNRTRQIVEIGVAYGSDYRLVERLLLAAASGDPDIATDPMPSVVLKNFADSSVVFDLRFVLEDVATISATTHQVKLRIAELFAENGVEIPFPQRDLHLKSVEPEAMKRWRRVEE